MGIVQYNTLLESYHRLKRLPDLLAEMEECQIMKNEFFYCEILRVFQIDGDYESALKYYEEAKASQIPINQQVSTGHY